MHSGPGFDVLSLIRLVSNPVGIFRVRSPDVVHVSTAKGKFWDDLSSYRYGMLGAPSGSLDHCVRIPRDYSPSLAQLQTTATNRGAEVLMRSQVDRAPTAEG
jgi:hypothetical protein